MLPPQLMTVRVRAGQRRPVRLWIPLLPVLILLSPLLVLALLVTAVALAVYHINPLRGLAAGFGVLHATRGLWVDIEAPDTTVHIGFK